ncbi:hypothetical protein KC727_00935 [Candidatus Kaiserbacteria bacterium]|nr:hypothetical protein [Candidatus Kaiserbacteria bacterium]
MKSELTFSREATNAGRAERVVTRYFRVRIGVRGSAHNGAKQSHCFAPFRLVTSAVRPPEKSFAVFLFLFWRGILFWIWKRIFLEGVPPERQWRRKEARIASPRNRSVRGSIASPRAPRVTTLINRFATESKFGFHHIDGAKQNTHQILGRLRRQGAENQQGFSTGFAKKRQAPDPAKAGSMFSEHSLHLQSEPIFFLLLRKSEAII